MSLRILLCVDGSSFSDAATDVALQLQAATGGALTALHVVNVTSKSEGGLIQNITGRIGFEPAIVSEEIESRHLDQAEVLLSAVRKRASDRGLQVRTESRQGAVREVIADESKHADLVVIGMRGRTEDHAKGQGGGNLEAFFHRVTVPLLLVPAEVHSVDAVAIGYDGSVAAAHALTALLRLHEAGFHVPCHALHVGGNREVLAEVEEQLPDVSAHVVRRDGPVHEVLAEEAESLGASMLAVGFVGNNRLKDFLYGSVTERLVAGRRMALLIAH